MDFRRLRIGELVAGAGGVLLIVALLLPWYTHDVATSFAGTVDLDSQTGFEALAVADVVLGVVAVAAIGLVITTAAERTVAIPIAYATLLSLAGLVAVVLVLAHLGASPTPTDPVAAEVRRSVQTGSGAGLYLALVATAAVLTGSLLAMRDERLSKRSRPTDGTGRPIEAPLEVERLAAPPAEPAP
ncbi:MAG: hypothetical protein M3433_07570 [Actinomycetota bacterium]|nr:hypothetical protein [Actinomycetota bacterium]MDQ3648427.1 hypothetical protein [Actinomycetota bacterium]